MTTRWLATPALLLALASASPGAALSCVEPDFTRDGISLLPGNDCLGAGIYAIAETTALTGFDDYRTFIGRDGDYQDGGLRTRFGPAIGGFVPMFYQWQPGISAHSNEIRINGVLVEQISGWKSGGLVSAGQEMDIQFLDLDDGPAWHSYREPLTAISIQTATNVPEPTTTVTLGIALLGLGVMVARRRRRQLTAG